MAPSVGDVIIAKKVCYNARKPGVKEQNPILTLNGSGVRDIGRVLKINKNTVISELKKAQREHSYS